MFNKILSVWIIFLFVFVNIHVLLIPRVVSFQYSILPINDSFGWQQEQLRQSAKAIATTLDSSTQNFSKQMLFSFSMTREEINHMNDVKQLVHQFRSLTGIMLFITVFLVAFLKQDLVSTSIARNICFQLAKSFAVLLIICLLVLLFWNQFFTSFHLLFFPQGNWSFPADSVLIRLFPDLFWQAMCIEIILLTTVELGVFTVTMRHFKKIHE